MDLDYRTLSNAGLWCIVRLQTDADRARVIDGLSIGRDDALANTIKRLSPRWFVARDVHAGEGPVLLQPRWALSFMRGPMTRNEIRRARALHGGTSANHDIETEPKDEAVPTTHEKEPKER